MALALVLWVLVAPFSAAAVVRRAPRLSRFVAEHYRFSLTAGWGGGAMVVAGALLAPSAMAALLLAGGAPLLGLACWKRVWHGGDDAPGGHQPAKPEPTGGDAIDWEKFMRDLQEWQKRSTSSPSRPSG